MEKMNYNVITLFANATGHAKQSGVSIQISLSSLKIEHHNMQQGIQPRLQIERDEHNKIIFLVLKEAVAITSLQVTGYPSNSNVTVSHLEYTCTKSLITDLSQNLEAIGRLICQGKFVPRSVIYTMDMKEPWNIRYIDDVVKQHIREKRLKSTLPYKVDKSNAYSNGVEAFKPRNNQISVPKAERGRTPGYTGRELKIDFSVNARSQVREDTEQHKLKQLKSQSPVRQTNHARIINNSKLPELGYDKYSSGSRRCESTNPKTEMNIHNRAYNADDYFEKDQTRQILEAGNMLKKEFAVKGVLKSMNKVEKVITTDEWIMRELEDIKEKAEIERKYMEEQRRQETERQKRVKMEAEELRRKEEERRQLEQQRWERGEKRRKEEQELEELKKQKKERERREELERKKQIVAEEARQKEEELKRQRKIEDMYRQMDEERQRKIEQEERRARREIQERIDQEEQRRIQREIEERKIRAKYEEKLRRLQEEQRLRAIKEVEEAENKRKIEIEREEARQKDEEQRKQREIEEWNRQRELQKQEAERAKRLREEQIRQELEMQRKKEVEDARRKEEQRELEKMKKLEEEQLKRQKEIEEQNRRLEDEEKTRKLKEEHAREAQRQAEEGQRQKEVEEEAERKRKEEREMEEARKKQAQQEEQEERRIFEQTQARQRGKSQPLSDMTNSQSKQMKGTLEQTSLIQSKSSNLKQNYNPKQLSLHQGLSISTSSTLEKENKISPRTLTRNNSDCSILSLNDPSQPKGYGGLYNMGNTCFMNSILQNLCNIQMFANYFLKNKHLKYMDLDSGRGKFALLFGEIINGMKGKGSISEIMNLEKTLLKRLENITCDFDGTSQNDALQFLKALLDTINTDISRVKCKPPYEALTVDPENRQASSDKWFKYMLSRENSIVTDLFCGQLLNKTTCSYGHEKLSFDNFWDLPLAFKNKNRPSHLEEMLASFLAEEQVMDTTYCDKCEKERKVRMQQVLWKLPRILVIHFKRFECFGDDFRKVDTSVTFPVNNLDLGRFITESKDSSIQDSMYTLCGIVHHYGSLNSGHYTAQCKIQQEKGWRTFNDSLVSKVDYLVKEETSKSAYILFYIKSSFLN